MSQGFGAPIDAPLHEFEFDLGETVRLLWRPTDGVIKGRTEFTNEDEKYFVELVDDLGHLVSIWVYGDALDKMGSAH